MLLARIVLFFGWIAWTVLAVGAGGRGDLGTMLICLALGFYCLWEQAPENWT